MARSKEQTKLRKELKDLAKEALEIVNRINVILDEIDEELPNIEAGKS